MNQILTGETRMRVVEQELARADVHPLDWQDDFGPFKFSQFNEFMAHLRVIDAAGGEPAREHELCVQLGYRDTVHFRRVQTTFLKYFGKSSGGDTLRSFVWDDAMSRMEITALEQREREQNARAALAADPALAAPEEGLTIRQYGWIVAQLAGRRALPQVLGEIGLDAGNWERVNAAWRRRIMADATGALKVLCTEAFTAAQASTMFPAREE